MHAITFFYAIIQCCFSIMFQRMFRHKKHEAYHADYKAFPESREAKEVRPWRRKAVPSEILFKRLYIPECKISLAFFVLCLHFQIVLDFRNKFFQTAFTTISALFNSHCSLVWWHFLSPHGLWRHFRSFEEHLKSRRFCMLLLTFSLTTSRPHEFF